MPEGDRFERKFQRVWIEAARYLRDDSVSVEETSDKLTKTLAKRLRDDGGVPGFDEMLRTVGSGHVDLLHMFETLDEIVKNHDGHRHAKLAVEVAKSALVQQPHGFVGTEGSLAKSFAENVCVAILDHYLFARAESQFVEEGRFASRNEFRSHRERLLRRMMPDIEKVAEQLSRSPNGKGLRAPNRRVPARSTGDLLEDDLL